MKKNTILTIYACGILLGSILAYFEIIIPAFICFLISLILGFKMMTDE